ncbi:hypothetical protein [Butyrivibrio sp. LC3010]|uniref:hypothetical protein n=1 Tax=Butyrivibrio sp. LC3010 TaxID=1280680 RepID=UPI000409DE38|nr:hypothetical protein [Butyrivibrio sp. LC3010]
MNNNRNYGYKTERRIPALPSTLALTLTEAECYLQIAALDLYSRIWIGQYDRIDDIYIYDTGSRWNKDSRRHSLFQEIRNILIPSLLGMGDYSSCSLGIWSEKTDIRAINAYDIQQRLRYELSWYKNPEGDITIDYDTPMIRGSNGDFSVFCETTDEGVYATLYLSQEHLIVMQTSLEVYSFLINRKMHETFKYYTSDEEVLSLAEELTRIYKEYEYLSFSSDTNYGMERYRNLIDKTSKIMEKIKDVNEEKAYKDFIRINISPTNPFIPLDDALRILDQPFEHFKKCRRKFPPQNVLELPGAGFLTRMRGKERATTDYLLVWYESSTKTEYYFEGEDYIIKHDGKIDLPDDIMLFIRKKCQEMRNKNTGE